MGCPMKVYAEYFEECGLTFRRNTLLQFGDSWELIGNVVLANPGSADPLMKASGKELTSLSRFYDVNREPGSFESINWYEFTPDSTMRLVEKIFNGWYVDRAVQLNGVIQLFNTFNIKDQDLTNAVKKIGIGSEFLFSRNVHKYFHDKPTYFGFSQQVIDDDILNDVAANIFNKSSSVVRSVYQNCFSDNPFYHPMYINRAYEKESFQGYRNKILSVIAESTLHEIRKHHV